MKVRIELTVDVDADTWAMEYGVDRRDVRKDFRAAAEAAIYEIAGSSQAEDDPMDHHRTTDDAFEPRVDDVADAAAERAAGTDVLDDGPWFEEVSK